MATLLSDFELAKKATRKIPQLTTAQINQVLNSLAESAVQYTDSLLVENKRDLDKMDPKDPKYDRLKLTPERIAAIAEDIKNVAKLEYPVGKVLEEKVLPNGLQLTKMTVPIGVVGIIYEARPNVTFDVFSLCIKSGNVCILKGGSDADYSNKAIVALIHQVLEQHGLGRDFVSLLPVERSATEALLNAVGYVDIIIPRGSQQLIDFVRAHAKVPVIETGAGIVHTYIDKSADLQKAVDIVDNAKTRRVSVCNALDCLIIHQDKIAALPAIVKPLADKKVQIFADEDSYFSLKSHYPEDLLQQALPEHFGIEFLSLKLSVKTVQNLQQALDHIDKYSSKHSEAIVAEDETAVDNFIKAVDAAAVYANTSTAFTDGAQFGLGAEIGISTQKLHARGPMALAELTSYKWIIKGNGQIRT